MSYQGHPQGHPQPTPVYSPQHQGHPSPQPQGYPSQEVQGYYAQQPQGYHAQQPQGYPSPDTQARGQPAPQHSYTHQAPMQAHAPVNQINGGDWQASLCDCSPFSSCIISCCIPCLLVGQTSERLRDPTMHTAESVNNDCLIHGALMAFTGCGWIYAMLKRTEIRERFGIPGSQFGDCCTTYWCHCCAVIQADNEVKKRLPVTGPIQQQYQPQKEGMVVPQH